MSDQKFITSYLQEMKDSGVNSFWIGVSGNNLQYICIDTHGYAKYLVHENIQQL